MKQTVINLLCLLTLVLGINVSAEDVKVVHIPDKNLEQAIREEIDISDMIQLTPAHMKMLTRLKALD